MYKIDSPISFEVDLESYCKDCDMADLTIDVITFMNICNKSHKMQTIRCNKSHKMQTIRCNKHDLCSTLYRHIKNATEKGEEKNEGD